MCSLLMNLGSFSTLENHKPHLFTSQSDVVVESGVHYSLYVNYQLTCVKFDRNVFYLDICGRVLWHYKLEKCIKTHLKN